MASSVRCGGRGVAGCHVTERSYDGEYVHNYKKGSKARQMEAVNTITVGPLSREFALAQLERLQNTIGFRDLSGADKNDLADILRDCSSSASVEKAISRWRGASKFCPSAGELREHCADLECEQDGNAWDLDGWVDSDLLPSPSPNDEATIRPSASTPGEILAQACLGVLHILLIEHANGRDGHLQTAIQCLETWLENRRHQAGGSDARAEPRA